MTCLQKNILNNKQPKRKKKGVVVEGGDKTNQKLKPEAHTNAAPASPPPPHDLHK